MNFSGKHTLLIGGSSGMGLAAAKLLLATGGRVTLVGRRNKEKLDRAEASLGTSDRVNTFQCDLNRNEDVERIVVHVANDMKDVAHLINAAGVSPPKSFVKHTRTVSFAEWHIALKINTLIPFSRVR